MATWLLYGYARSLFRQAVLLFGMVQSRSLSTAQKVLLQSYLCVPMPARVTVGTGRPLGAHKRPSL